MIRLMPNAIIQVITIATIVCPLVQTYHAVTQHKQRSQRIHNTQFRIFLPPFSSVY